MVLRTGVWRDNCLHFIRLLADDVIAKLRFEKCQAKQQNIAGRPESPRPWTVRQ
jgi:hypothetical protein